MSKFKLYDVWTSVLLIFSFTVFSLLKLDYTFVIGYCIVGAWQLTSMLLHAGKGWFSSRGTARYYYHCIVAVILSLGALGILFPSLLLLVLYPMLFLAPFMAVYYTWLCYNEVYVKMQRPLALLK